jgi:hypothetical protein
VVTINKGLTLSKCIGILVYLAWLVNLIAGLLWAAVGVDVLTVVSAVSAYMFNVGAGLAA